MPRVFCSTESCCVQLSCCVLSIALKCMDSSAGLLKVSPESESHLKEVVFFSLYAVGVNFKCF